MRNRSLFFYSLMSLAMVLLLTSCKKSSDSSSNPTPTTYTEWYSHKQNTTDTISVQGGYVYMSTAYSSGNSLGTDIGSFNKIIGDFELRFKYSSFHVSGSQPGSEVLGFSLVQNGIKKSILSGMLTNSLVYISDTSSTSIISKATVNRDGEFYVKRTGSSYNSWIRAGADTVFFNKTNYTTADLSLTLEIGTLDNTPTSRTSVHIDDFTITGGGGAIVSDPFDKNNITAY